MKKEASSQSLHTLKGQIGALWWPRGELMRGGLEGGSGGRGYVCNWFTADKLFYSRN